MSFFEFYFTLGFTCFFIGFTLYLSYLKFIKIPFHIEFSICERGFFHAKRNGYSGIGISKKQAIKNLNFIVKDDLNA